ncbi:MAG: CRTAC1 family protein [Pyrinomonadaceae bacterium]|nr:CRTAC1 family protein [Pyrinomonadaceae bacterium]
MKSFKQFTLIILFIGLLSIPFFVKKYYVTEKKISIDKESAMKRYGFYFEEVAEKSGVNFSHSAPKLDTKVENIMPIIASMGAGVAVADFDKDGWNDFYLTNSSENSFNSLYRNNQDGSFTDVAKEAGVADLNNVETGVSMGAVWGDFDNDGFEDLLVYKWGKTELFKNNSGKNFTKIENTNFPEWANINSAIWFDYDRDGLLDVVLGGYFREDLNLWNLKDSRIMPESFEYAKNGGRKYVFKNLGSGKFEEVSEKLGIKSNRWSLALGSTDLNDDGFPDLFIANDYGVSELFFNDRGTRFIDVGENSGVGFAPKSGMNASFGDVLNQGKQAIYVSNISEESVLLQGNNLWMPKPNTNGMNLKFENQANNFGVEFAGWSWGTQFGDLNNDGNLDLFVTNGYISAEKATSYWYDYSKITVGNNAIIGDAANWGKIEKKSLAGYQQKKVWLNDGAGKFNDVALSVGVSETFDGRAVAFADLWNRGVLDVIVAHQNAPVLIYKNTVSPENNWISFELEGEKSNKSAIGSSIKVFWNGQVQKQTLDGGIGFCSQNQRRLHFGLGKNAAPERVEIRWSSGKIQIIDAPAVNKVHKIKE